MSSHNLAGVPKLASSRKAVSGLMPRRPATISCIRCGGTRSFNAKAFDDRPRASSSSLRIAPGCICSNAGCAMKNSSMIIDNLYVFGIAVSETKYQTPRTVDRHRPLTLAISDQRMQADRIKRRNVVNRSSCTQNLQPRHCLGNIHPAEFRLAFIGKALSGPVGVTHDHLISIPRYRCHVKRVMN
jgi:hypothetical protein